LSIHKNTKAEDGIRKPDKAQGAAKGNKYRRKTYWSKNSI
jgi:hypothetical protein